MSLNSKLNSIKSRLTALLTYANETTGASDTNIGDAINTLCSGYGAEDHTIEDALITNTAMDEYVNERVTTIGMTNRNDVFGSCQIKKVSLPNVTKCPASYAFHGRNISTMEELYLPKMTSCGYGLAENNPCLKTLDLGQCMGAARIRSCTVLTTLIIRNTSVPSPATSWFTGTPFATDGAGGYVYVPSSLLSSYESNSAWASNANVLEFRTIEGSIYE